MNLWIETSNLARAEPLFGVPPLERLRRSTKPLAREDSVVLSGPDVGQAAWPGDQSPAE